MHHYFPGQRGCSTTGFKMGVLKMSLTSLSIKCVDCLGRIPAVLVELYPVRHAHTWDVTSPRGGLAEVESVLMAALDTTKTPPAPLFPSLLKDTELASLVPRFELTKVLLTRGDMGPRRSSSVRFSIVEFGPIVL
jgi:hypothetical protein